MLHFLTTLILFFFVALSKELFFLNEEVILIISFGIVVSVLLDIVGQLAFSFCDAEIKEMGVRFRQLLTQRALVLRDLLKVRVRRKSSIAIFKQLMLLVWQNFPRGNGFYFAVRLIIASYGRLLFAFFAYQLQVYKEFFKASLVLLSLAFGHTSNIFFLEECNSLGLFLEQRQGEIDDSKAEDGLLVAELEEDFIFTSGFLRDDAV